MAIAAKGMIVNFDFIDVNSFLVLERFNNYLDYFMRTSVAAACDQSAVNPSSVYVNFKRADLAVDMHPTEYDAAYANLANSFVDIFRNVDRWIDASINGFQSTPSNVLLFTYAVIGYTTLIVNVQTLPRG